MNETPTVDTQSPWYEAFTPAPELAARRVPGTTFPAPATAAPAKRQAAEDTSATDALFECYNG